MKSYKNPIREEYQTDIPDEHGLIGADGVIQALAMIWDLIDERFPQRDDGPEPHIFPTFYRGGCPDKTELKFSGKI